MKRLLFIASLVSCYYLQAQRTYMYGVVKDSLSHELLIGAHVRNLNAGSLTSTNEEGRFKMPIQPGDTLVISSVGYETMAWISDSSWSVIKEVEFNLPHSIVYLEEVVVGEFPEYVRFKDLIIKTQPEDTTFQVFGVPQVVMDPYPQLEKKEYLHPAFIFFHPISAMHHSFSGKEKEKRKLQHIKKTRYTTEKARLKFRREWVGENTKLEGDQLTSFIAYCNFSDAYLASASEFEIYELMMDLLPKFLKQQEEG